MEDFTKTKRRAAPWNKGKLLGQNLAAVLDAYSRALVGWAMSRTLDTKLAMDALNMAIAHWGSPVTLGSDQGSTCATGSYREIVTRYGRPELTIRRWRSIPL